MTCIPGQTFIRTDMAQLTINLLGSFQVTLDERHITNFATDKARALLAFLAVERDRPHRREALAALLWPEQPEERARQSLRQALLHLRQALCDSATACPFILLDRNELQLNPAADVVLDVIAFTTLAEACESHQHRSREACLPCLRRSAAMLDGYSGEFLAGFSIPDSAVFEEWALMKQEWLHVRAMEGLMQLADYHERRGDVKMARAYAQRQVQLEPWREEAHRQLMRLLALDGQRSAALAQYETCRRILRAEFSVEPAMETTQLRAQIEGQAGYGYPLVSAQEHAPVFDLPATPFLGREAELAEISELLASPHCRLLTVTGPGGIGKTRLALEIAERHRGLFVDGVAFIDLAAVTGRDAMAAVIGDALALPADPKHDWRWLCQTLHNREVLLVLDSFEHLVDAGALLSELLHDAPGVILLVVSRERLRLHEEWVYPLGGLPYPSSLDLIGAAPLRYGALALFRQRAVQVQRHFALTEEVLPAVIRICALVDGLPLGIELAAAAVAERSCPEIAEALAQTLDALETTFRNAPARHHSLRATFEHAWGLLSSAEQRCFTALAVFALGFDNEAARAVADTAGNDLTTLVAKSLLTFDGGRYAWHQVSHQYAQERLEADQGRVAGLRDRHCEFYAGRVAGYAALMDGEGAREAQAAMEADHANVERAWRWAVSQRRVASVSKLLVGLAKFHRLRGPVQEGLDLIGYALDSLGSSEETPLDLLARLRVEQAQLFSLQQRYEDALACIEQLIELGTRRSSGMWLGTGLFLRGQTLQQQGQYEEALRALEEGLWSLDALGSSAAADSEIERLMANLMRELGNIATRQGEQLQAQQRYEQALRSYQALHDLRGESAVLNNLGALAWDRGDYALAQARLIEALKLYRMLGNLSGEAKALNNLANLAADQYDYDRALRHYQDVLEIHRATHNTQAQSAALNNLGALLWELGRYREARDAYRRALTLYRASGNRQAEGETLGNLSLLELRTGNLQAALAWGRQAVSTSKGCHDVINLANVYSYLGKIHAAAHQWCEADAAYRAALAIRTEVPHPGRLLELTACLAYLTWQQGDAAQALIDLTPVLEALEEDAALEGSEEPYEVYWVCYEVLRANGDPRAASLLATAKQRLMAHADQISDMSLRQSFLENVPANSRIARSQSTSNPDISSETCAR
ncbi:MAG: tetratricopeptide repeat protein [Anaerolineae bacterium]|nr:tetratricopeptide repeat protein [Anaerolineae bacterium]